MPIYLLIIVITSCYSNNSEESKKPFILENGTEIFTDLKGINYKTVYKRTVVGYNTIWYTFSDYLEEDSIEWHVDDPTIKCIFYPNTNKVKKLDIISYQGKIPDSLDFSNLQEIEIDNCILEGNISLLQLNKVITANIYKSFFFDSLVDLSIFQNLERVTLINNKTEFYLNEKLPIKDLSYTGYFIREVNISKLNKLDSLYIMCVDCSFDLPSKKLKRFVIRTNELDTIYNAATPALSRLKK